ncbi:DUF4013 domain-containing protein [Methanobacterium oryzae]|uniref:DUF4013 domain-containing protein n=1 Tax=Methanobacterium oryzae TaxID=69540 RepID=UPI003D1B1831
MNIVDNITSSLKYPLNDWVKILILTIISIIPIVNFISAGYMLRIIKSTLAGIDEVPGFDDLGELFIDGIKILIVSIVYMIVPLIIYFVALLPLMFTSDPYSMMSGLMSGLTIVILLIDIVVAIIFSLVLYPAIVNMALYDSELGAAFRFSEILDRIKAIGWGDYILWIIAIIVTSIVVGVILGIVGAILMIILIGFLVWFAMGAYLTMFQARSIGLLFSESME